MAYGEVFEGTGEELAGRVAALGKARLRVEVLEEGTRPKPRRTLSWEENDRKLAELMKGAPVLPDRSFFTAEDLYLPDGLGPDG